MNLDEVRELAREAGLANAGGSVEFHNLPELQRFANLVLASRKPLTDERIWKIIEEQSALTGWKVPPTKQVARAVERDHGIGTEDAYQPPTE